MNKKVKKNLIEYSVILGILTGLFLTGLHTEVFGFIQRGILMTGIFRPAIQKEPLENNSFPKADYNLNLINSQGQKIRMEDFRGKVIFMNLWATWCPPCIAEMPGINKLYGQAKDDGILFLMISVDDDFEKAKKFHARKGYDFEVFAIDGFLPPVYHSQTIPTTYVISARGELVLSKKGMSDYNTRRFLEYLKSLK